MKIGVLGIHGSVSEHMHALSRIGVEPVAIKIPSHLSSVSGLIIPGGESTALYLLMERYGLRDEILRLYRREGLHIFGTCAGAILLSKRILNLNQGSLGLLDVTIERNAYGRQIDSFEADVEILGKKVHCMFIRAPVITQVGEGVQVLGVYEDSPIMVQQGRILATTFHTELSEDTTLHSYFASMCKNK